MESLSGNEREEVDAQPRTSARADAKAAFGEAPAKPSARLDSLNPCPSSIVPKDHRLKDSFSSAG